ncbi:hypothetical protein ACKI1J_32665 [Streptomyces scabiei]|uniref:hypothetical protein n=1 Tax=Streptomyces scabiei TaxID=1930 RepID=UPI0039F08939
MSNKKNTVKAAKAQISKDTKNNPAPPATSTQGSLADRHVRNHTPDILYGEEDAATTEQP